VLGTGSRRIRLLMIFLVRSLGLKSHTRYVTSGHAKLRARNQSTVTLFSQNKTLFLKPPTTPTRLFSRSLISAPFRLIESASSIRQLNLRQLADHLHSPCQLPLAPTIVFLPVPVESIATRTILIPPILLSNRVLPLSLSRYSPGTALSSRHGSYRRNGNVCCAPCILRCHTSSAKKKSLEHEDIQSSEMATQVPVTYASKFPSLNCN